MIPSPPNTPPGTALTVSELVTRARRLLEQGLPVSWIRGEISNLTRAASGHVYFSLKDASAQVRCVMFRQRAQLVPFRLENGADVEVHAQATLYEPRGDFQLNVDAVRLAGRGNLYEQFLRLKERLDAEGLFDPARKRAVPALPRAVGVVTSTAAAALRDVITTLRRRAPHLPVIIYPSPVQGDGAGLQLAQRLHTAAARAEVDLLLLVRGGGSLEDLWAFNDEALVRAVAASPIPVICGVGHETDFTLADFAADLRAPTPTAAAELASAGFVAARSRLDVLRTHLVRSMAQRLERRMQQVDGLSRRLLSPQQQLARQRERLAHLGLRLQGALRRRAMDLGQRVAVARARLAPPAVAAARTRVDALQPRLQAAAQRHVARAADTLKVLGTHLQHLNPRAVLGRGYSIARLDDGRVVRSYRELEPGAALRVDLADGWAATRVEDSGPADPAPER